MSEADREGTIPARVKHWSTQYPDREVFIFYSDQSRRVLTCRDVHILSNKFAALIQRRGLKPGDVVCNTLINSPERVVSDFGILAAGCVTANGQALLTDGTDLLHVINRSKCRLLIADLAGGPWKFIKGHLGDVVDGKVRSEKAPCLEMVQFVGAEKGDGFMENLMLEVDGRDPVHIRSSDVCFYLCTSGSTGFSKLVSLDHSTLLNCSINFCKLFKLDPEKKLYSDRPLGWSGGWPYSFIEHAIPQVMIDARGTAADHLELSWRAIVTDKCTFAILPLSVLKALAERKDLLTKYDFYLLDMVIATGQPFRKHCHDVIGKVCRIVSSAYGISEAGYITSCLCENEEDFEDNLVGRTSTMLEMKVVDENLHEVKQGQNGQVLLRGPTIYGQYANNPEATKHTYTEDGWLKTGDMGHQDKHGRFFVEGRQSDAIMHGEYIIYPAWVERKLRTCPFIAEVMVVGIPDEIMYHRICACVIPTAGSDVTGDELKEYCDPMFTDDIIHEITAKPEFYVVVESFPLRPTGKPDRRALADIAAKLVAGS